MATKLQNSASFKTILQQDKPVLVDFYADWCGPCQMQLPIVDALSKTHGEQVEVLKVDVDQHQEIAQAYGVRSIPTLLLFQNGEVVDKMVGYQSAQVLETKVLQLAATA